METGLFIACAALTAACALIAVYFMKAFREKTYDRAAILKTAAGLCFLMIGVLFAAGMSGDKPLRVAGRGRACLRGAGRSAARDPLYPPRAA